MSSPGSFIFDHDDPTLWYERQSDPSGPELSALDSFDDERPEPQTEPETSTLCYRPRDDSSGLDLSGLTISEDEEPKQRTNPEEWFWEKLIEFPSRMIEDSGMGLLTRFQQLLQRPQTTRLSPENRGVIPMLLPESHGEFEAIEAISLLDNVYGDAMMHFMHFASLFQDHVLARINIFLEFSGQPDVVRALCMEHFYSRSVAVENSLGAANHIEIVLKLLKFRCLFWKRALTHLPQDLAPVFPKGTSLPFSIAHILNIGQHEAMYLHVDGIKPSDEQPKCQTKCHGTKEWPAGDPSASWYMIQQGTGMRYICTRGATILVREREPGTLRACRFDRSKRQVEFMQGNGWTVRFTVCDNANAACALE